MYDSETKYFQCMKAGMLAHLHGYAPAISVEFARKMLFADERPHSYEVEETTAALPPGCPQPGRSQPRRRAGPVAVSGEQPILIIKRKTRASHGPHHSGAWKVADRKSTCPNSSH